MQPLKQTMTMTTLDLASSFANRHWALPRDWQAVLFFLQKDVSQHRQRPKAQQGLGAHELVMVQTKFFFPRAKEDFNVPSSRDVGEQHLGRRFQIAGGPVPRLGKRGGECLTHDHDLTSVELAHAGGHNMDVDLLATAWPRHLHKVLLRQTRQIVTELLPAPPLRRCLIGNTQPAIAPEAGRDEKVSLAREPHATGLWRSTNCPAKRAFSCLRPAQTPGSGFPSARFCSGTPPLRLRTLSLVGTGAEPKGTDDPAERRVLAAGCGR